ncbi:MAG: hypothetical protein CL928_12890 [Deltaproteobacteria bacterium]|nr:hypothetical protein [Deltaproteobacteria bacterium]
MTLKSLTACAILPIFALGSFLSTAEAGPRDGAVHGDDSAARGDDHSMTTERLPQRAPAAVEFDFQVAWYYHDQDGVYDIGMTIDDELFNVQIEGEDKQAALSIYDAEGDLVLGYVVSRSSVVLFDSEGLVERNQGEPLTTSIREFGLAPSILADPVVVLALAEAGGAVVGADGDSAHPVAWWAVGLFIARCIDIQVNIDADGGFDGGSISWDC